MNKIRYKLNANTEPIFIFKISLVIKLGIDTLGIIEETKPRCHKGFKRIK